MNFPIGHDNIASQLRQLHNGGKLPHSFLFYGPKGVGKATLAHVFARFLLCGPKPQEPTAALFEEVEETEFPLAFNTAHELYPQIEAGSTPDFHVLTPLEGKQSINAEQVRGVIEKLGLSSDHPRVVLIDGAELMTTAAANVVLKTLEEPQPNIHFILVSHGLSKLLPTIVSRCRQFRFKPLAEAEVQEVLEIQKIDISPDKIAFASGCPGHAILLATQGQQVTETVEKIMQTRAITAAEAGILGKKENFSVAMGYLLQHLHALAIKNKSDNKYSILYNKVNQINKDSKEYNLSGHLAIENAFNSVLKTIGEGAKS